MDVFLGILAIVCASISIVGSVVPVVPGVVLGYLSLWIAQWSGVIGFSPSFMIIMGVIAGVIFVSDYIIPSAITRRFGGSKAASWGAFFGMIVGMVFTPIGMILGMILGAFIGYLISSDGDSGASAKAALGSFVGFILSAGIKMFYCFYVLWVLVVEYIGLAF